MLFGYRTAMIGRNLNRLTSGGQAPRQWRRSYQSLLGRLLLGATLLFCGCDAAVEHFPANGVYALVVSTNRVVETELAAEDTSALLENWFGTPESPRWPAQLLADSASSSLVSEENLNRAAGRVYSDQDNNHFGLYNEHCVRCHGVAGGGNGPASQLQNPYPRDFRAGIYKWKSTTRAAKPTRSDLSRVILHGIPGTGMPSFSQLDDGDLEALTDYVIYLSIRGEFERRLLAGAIDELGYEETRPDRQAQLGEIDGDGTDAREFAIEVLRDLCERWLKAQSSVIEPPEETAAGGDSVARGKELFHGPIANCVGCHGNGGDARSVTTLDYDDWTKEFTTRLSITPTDRDAIKPFRDAGALRPRQTRPRQLTTGVFRGGGDPQTLYRRLVAGIAGVPMPGVIVTEQASATGLTSAQVWDLVHYVESLGADR